ncbi:hypothetical protein ADP64_000062 [Achromobacter phage phiAxp-2]|uniref:Uncharacterized protein n=1 Tax=Achromobacter phage phiAxp-2 TaxID=1664246 RepID=A0A0K2FH60_9CAUD|nr:hypothetical protein ADP64_000062 [Achromobacter phage phiAxp-2]ALA45408.1 hypothetical protein ADP64_000062 [Achromobacter phage phiAxp-2]
MANSKRGRKFQDVKEYQRLANMEAGESCFYEGKRPRELLNVRRMTSKLKMDIVMRYQQEDVKEQTAGTRMWCVKAASKVALRHIVNNAEDDEL